MIPLYSKGTQQLRFFHHSSQCFEGNVVIPAVQHELLQHPYTAKNLLNSYVNNGGADPNVMSIKVPTSRSIPLFAHELRHQVSSLAHQVQ
jgi:polyphosphate kinase